MKRAQVSEQTAKVWCQNTVQPSQLCRQWQRWWRQITTISCIRHCHNQLHQTTSSFW